MIILLFPHHLFSVLQTAFVAAVGEDSSDLPIDPPPIMRVRAALTKAVTDTQSRLPVMLVLQSWEDVSIMHAALKVGAADVPSVTDDQIAMIEAVIRQASEAA